MNGKPDSWTIEQWDGLLEYLSRDLVLSHPLVMQRPIPEEDRKAILDFLAATMSLSFSETLLRIIDDRGLNDVEVYKKAKVDRRVFSRLRSSRTYQPSRATAIRFCLALGLCPEESLALLEKAGFCLSATKKEDAIILYCLKAGIRDIDMVNDALLAFDLKTI